MAGLLARWLGRRRGPEGPALADDGTLALLAESYDLAAADSAVVAAMAERGAPLAEPLLVRHHLLLPDELAVDEAARLLAQDGYALVVGAGEVGEGEAVLRVRASRAQLVTGLSLAQERSRMAGLAQRLGGDVVGYDVLGPAAAGEPAAER
ncbi:MAG: ribonuclease E inhibitor RraB [Motilibacteraceae bacterium]